MDMVTLGMLIIDEIHFQNGDPPATNILGGAGTFAVVGARMFREPPDSEKIGWTVHKGTDFPAKVEEQIKMLQTNCNLVDTPSRLTTRGWNKYGDHEERAFKYLTEKLRIDHTQLTEPMIRSRCFHLICTPTRCINLVKGILSRRCELDLPPDSRPMFVWEPVPDSCGPEEYINLLQAMKYINVVSPNHSELAALLRADSSPATSEPYSEQAVLKGSSQLLKDGFRDKKGAVVIRCGEHGCYVASHGFAGFLPAYHQSRAHCPSSVIDPTGAGNTFLGAFCIGMIDAEQLGVDAYKLGATYGSIAAGCAVEQVGLPFLTRETCNDLWNGIGIVERREKYEQLLRKMDHS